MILSNEYLDRLEAEAKHYPDEVFSIPLQKLIAEIRRLRKREEESLRESELKEEFQNQCG